MSDYLSLQTLTEVVIFVISSLQETQVVVSGKGCLTRLVTLRLPV